MAKKKMEKRKEKSIEMNTNVVGRETAEHLQGGTPQSRERVNHSLRRKHVHNRGVSVIKERK
jgi:hypothetical protein